MTRTNKHQGNVTESVLFSDSLGSGDSTTGRLLQRLRVARGMSLTHVAERAGIASITLRRWESERFQPRLPELYAVLQALKASPADCDLIVRTVDAPRALHFIRKAACSCPTVEIEAKSLPALGKMLKTLRLRRGLSQQQVAAQLGVHRSTVTYWEQSRTAPPTEAWDALLNVLGARPEEQTALHRSAWLPSSPDPPAGSSLDALEAELHTLRHALQCKEQELIDLRFFQLEERLWTAMRRQPAANVLLVEACTLHSRWLWWQARRREATVCADTALRLLERSDLPSVPLERKIDLAHIAAGLLADRLTPTGITGALKQLHDWLPMATTAATQTMLQRDKADFLARLNRIDVALETAQTALRLASQSNDAAVIGMTQFTYAVVLTQAGRAQDALPLLRTEDLGVPIQNMHEAFQWCRALAALRERDAAEKWLCRAREMIETEGLTAYRETTNELAKLL